MERQLNHSLSNDERKWMNIEIHGAEYMISNVVLKTSWRISLSNLVEIWTETITKDIALARCQSLNPLLDVDSFDFKETLDSMLNDIPKYATDKSVNEIKLRTIIDGIAFKFTINLTKGSPGLFWNEITKPLYQSSMELQRRHEIVLDLIKRKDEELSEYKLGGAQLIRKNIETLPYNMDMFRNTISVKSDNCINAFQSMMNIYNELRKYETLSRNECPPLVQKFREKFLVEADIKTEIENSGASEGTFTVNVNSDTELRSRIETETTTVNPLVHKNESIASGTEIIERCRVGQTKPSIDESELSLRTEKKPQKRRSINVMTNVPLASKEEPSKKSEKLKMKPNIYDFIA